MDTMNPTTKNPLVPDYIIEAICLMFQERETLGESIEDLAARVASLGYTSGLTAGLNTALLLCEETNKNIHTAVN